VATRRPPVRPAWATSGTQRAEHQALRLASGRLVGFAEYGDPSGKAVLLCHREVGSRLLGRALHLPAAERGLRLVVPDRPGMGFSDFQVGRAVADWPADVGALAQALELGRFAVVGTNGGAAYALACAWRLAERVDTVVLAATALPPSLGPSVPAARGLGRRLAHTPWASRAAMTALALGARRSRGALVDRMVSSAARVDQPAFAGAGTRAMLAESLAETFRSGPRGAAADLALLGAEWGLPLGDIGPGVRVVHGERDTEVRPVDARRLALALAQARFDSVADAGHHLALSHPEALLEVLG
jgi:pimeloyl-ACP methyl ester carboxylesterase